MANEQTPDLGSMLSEVMHDPAKLAQLRQIMAALGSGSPLPGEDEHSAPEAAASAPQDPSPTAEGSTDDTTVQVSTPPSADLLSGLLSNPALLTQLPSMMAMLGPLMGGGESKSGSSSSPPKKHGPDHRTALLLALKPYLNDGRREMIDYIVNLSRLGDQLGR